MEDIQQGKKFSEMEGRVIDELEFEDYRKKRIGYLNEFMWHQHKSPHDLDYCDYDWRPFDRFRKYNGRLSGNIDLHMFDVMSMESASEIANYANAFVKEIRNIWAWMRVLDGVDDENERLDIWIEFVNIHIHYGIGLPYAIKQKIMFSFCGIAHRMRMFSDANYPDELAPKEKVNDKTFKKFTGDSAPGDRLIDFISNVDSKEFSIETGDFRNGFNHRVTPAVYLGMSELAERHFIIGGTSNPFEGKMIELEMRLPKSGERRAIYSLGGKKAIPLQQVLNAMIDQAKKIHDCFQLYKEFVIDCEMQVLRKMSK